MRKANQDLPTNEQLLEENKRLRARLEQAEQTLQTRRDHKVETQETPRREQMEQALRESEARFRLALKSAPVSVATQDRDLVFQWAFNQRTVPVEKILGKTDYDLFPQEADHLIALKRKVLETGREAREKLWIHSGGQRLFLDLLVEPLLDKSGKICGVGLATIDLTQIKLAEDALRESEQKYSVLFGKTSIPAALTRMSDKTFVDANEAFEKLFGWTREELIGRTSLELGITKPEEFQVTVDKIQQQDLQNKAEKHVLTKSGEERIVLLNVNALELNGNAYTLSTMQDITERKKAEDALRQSEELFKVIASSIPDHILVQNHDLIYTFVANPQMGLTEQEMIGKTDFDFLSKEDAEKLTKIKRGVLETGNAVHVELPLISPGGEAQTFNGSYVPKYDMDGQIDGLIGYFKNVTELKQAEENQRQLNRTLRALSNINQAMIHSTDEAGFMDAACQIVVRDCGHAMAWIGMAEQDDGKSVRPVASAGFEEGYLETLNITWADTERGRGPTGTAIRTGEVSMCRNMLTDPKFKPWRAEALKRGYASSIVLPLISAGRALGAFTIYSREPDPFSDEEVKLLDEMAGDLAYGITMIRTRRAHELAQAALSQSEARFRQLADASFEGLVIHADGLMLDVNARLSNMVGYYPAELTGKPFWDFIEPKYHDLVRENILKEYTGEYELELIHKDGRKVPVEVVGRSIEWEGRQARVSALRDISERKRSEETLYRQGKMLDLSYEAIFAWEFDGTIISWNRGAEQLYGYSSEEALGKVSHQLLRTVHSQKIDTIKANLVRDMSWTGELEHITKDGRKILVESRHQLLGDEPGTQIVLETNRNITERKRAEAALRESEEKYRSLVKYAPAGIYEVDFSTGRFTEVNDVMCQILGYRREELLAMTAFNILDDEGKALFASRIRLAESNEDPAPTMEYRVLTKVGRLIWALLNVTFHRKDGKIVGATVIANDITERKQTEEALRKNEATLRGILDATQESIWLFSPDGTILMANETALSRLGRSAGEVIGKPFSQLVPEELARSRQTRLNQVVKRGRPVELVDERSGIMFHHNFYPVKDSDGKVIQIVSFSRDITRQNQVEQTLRESEERFRNITETLPVLISLTTTDDSTIAFTNTAYNEAFGFRREEIIGRKGPDVYYNPADRIKMLDILREQGSVHNYQLKAKKSDGTPIWLLSSVLPTIYDGRPAILGASIDITKSIEAEQAQRESEERYRNLFNAMEEGFCIIEVLFDAGEHPIDYRFLEINPAFENQTGLHDAQGKLMRELAPDHEAFWFEAYGKIALTGVAARFENEAKALKRWYEVFAYRVGGPESRRVAILFNDISERKKAQDEAFKLLTAIQAEKERLAALINNISDEVWFADTDKKFTLANPAALREFGMDPGNAIDVEKFVASLEVLRVDGSPRPLDEAPPLRALRGESVKNQEEVVRIPAYGQLRHREVSATPVRDPDGKIIGAISVVHDITERKKAEEALKSTNDELARFNKVMIGRELRMIELKKEVNALCEMAGQPPHYSLSFETEDL